MDGEEVASGCSPTIPSPDDCSNSKKLQTEKSLTEEISELLTGGILSGDLKPDSQNFSQSILALRNRVLQESGPLLVIDNEKINFSLINDDSQKSRQEYINNLSNIIEDYILSNSNHLSPNSLNENSFIESYFSQGANSSRELYQKLSQLSVPPSWLEFHKKILVFLKKSEIYYQNIIDYKKDPIKSLLTLNTANSLQLEYKEIIKTALQKIKEQNLKPPSDSLLNLLSSE